MAILDGILGSLENNRAWAEQELDGGGGLGLFNTQWSETPVLDGLAPAAEATWNVESKCSCSTLRAKSDDVDAQRAGRGGATLVVDHFVDTLRFTIRSGGWQVRLGSEGDHPVVTKSPANPLLQEDKPWEAAWWNTELSTIYDPVESRWHMYWNSHFECGPVVHDAPPDKPPPPAGMCPHDSYSARFPGIKPSNSKCGVGGGPTCASGVEYASSGDGIRWEKPTLGLVAFNGSKTNNILVSATGGDPDLGFYFDLHEKNLSRRFKAFGTGLSDDPRDSHGWARVDVAWSADALHWPASGSRRIVHESEIGQNDGTADNVVYDTDLQLYIGYVRLDNMTNCGCTTRGGVCCCAQDGERGSCNRRRTGRTTSRDFVTWTKAVEVFRGQLGFEIYTLEPWRLDSWRPGRYLAMGAFYCHNETSAVAPLPNCTLGSVYNELLATNDHGEHWSRLAPGRQWIPHGPPGSPDSSIIYAGRPLLNPANRSETRIYYDGGRGPHSGPHREDTINLATCLTDAYAGLATVPAGSDRASNGTALLHPPRWTVSAAVHPAAESVHVLAQLGAGSRLLAERFRPPSSGLGGSDGRGDADRQLRLQASSAEAMRAPRWITLSLGALDLPRQQEASAAGMHELWVEVQGQGTLFALQQGGRPPGA